MKENLRSLIGLAIVVLVFSTAARAEIFTAYLSGAQEVPAAATSATGYARIILNESAGTISYTVVFNGLSSNQTASHIHAPAPIGANTGVAINFGAVGGTSGTISGTASITPTQIGQLRAHQGYVNVHSANFPGGEIRGQIGVQRVVDYDGDGRTDVSVLKFPNVAAPGAAPMVWWNRNLTGDHLQIREWGDANRDFPAPGDYDGDGINDLAYYRAGATSGAQSEYWIIQSSNNAVRCFAWGLFGDQTVARDYDGDGITDVAVYRRGATSTSQGTWYIRESSTGNARVEGFGTTGNGTTSFDTPIPGDYDGDGKFDLAVYRFGQAPANNYIIKRSSDNVVSYQAFGNFNSDYILPGDYDGDGKYDLAVARTGTSTAPLVWWILNSSTNTTRTQIFGISTDLPVQGDYDGDARTDIAIYRRGATSTSNSTFWIYRSFDNVATSFTWGLQTDFPVANFDAR